MRCSTPLPLWIPSCCSSLSMGVLRLAKVFWGLRKTKDRVSLVADQGYPPTAELTNGMKRRRGCLKSCQLPLSLEPCQPTAVELAVREENTQRVLTLLKCRPWPDLDGIEKQLQKVHKACYSMKYNSQLNVILTCRLIKRSTISRSSFLCRWRLLQWPLSAPMV